MVVSNRNLPFQRSIFRCYVSFRECNPAEVSEHHGPIPTITSFEVNKQRHVCVIGSMGLVYLPTFTIKLTQMWVNIPVSWILWKMRNVKKKQRFFGTNWLTGVESTSKIGSKCLTRLWLNQPVWNISYAHQNGFIFLKDWGEKEIFETTTYLEDQPS